MSRCSSAASCSGRENEIAEAVHGSGPAGGKIRCRAQFSDNGGADDAIAGTQPCAIVQRGATPAAFFEDAVRRDECRAARIAAS